MSRRAPAAALLLLLIAVVAVVLVTVPFPVLPGAHPHVDVARDFTPAQLAHERDFHHRVHPPAYAALAVSLLAAAVLGLTRLGGRLVTAVARPFGGGWGWQVVLGTTAVLAVGRLVTLPLDVRAERVLRDYGLSTQAWPGWLLDQLKGLGIAAGTTALVLLVLVALARRAPRTWWAWAAASAAVLVFLGSFVYPVVVEPAFNSFTPLAAGGLRTDLLTLARRDHVPVRDVLVADASRRTTSLNAYVSGFGSTRRVVLYDTLLRSESPRQVELVVAHELGHAKRQDVLHGTILGALGAASGSCGLYLLLQWGALVRRSGASGPGDPRVVPLVLLLAAVATFATSPLTDLVSRHIEARADIHSLELTGDVLTFISSQQRLATADLSTLAPSALVYALFFDHPSTPQRLALARAWAQLHPRR
jgi:STE24 endopeptidase